NHSEDSSGDDSEKLKTPHQKAKLTTLKTCKLPSNYLSGTVLFLNIDESCIEEVKERLKVTDAILTEKTDEAQFKVSLEGETKQEYLFFDPITEYKYGDCIVVSGRLNLR